MKIISIIGNRPQFIKAAIVQRAWEQIALEKNFQMRVIHTGQHYDANLSDIFFTELGINPPDYNLAIGSGDITDQIANMLLKLKVILAQEKPDAVIVYGDTNSTIAGSLAAAHKNIPVIHIEAGERLYIRDNQPEEINRIVTDSLSSLCLTSSKKAQQQLKNEGISNSRIRFVGDTMYDLFLWTQKHLQKNNLNILEEHELKPETYILSTIHRAENTNNTERLLSIFDSLENVNIPVILPIHPRTAAALKKIGWQPAQGSLLKIIDPCGYLDLMTLLENAKFVVTDSGGLSRESFFAKKLSVVPMSAPPWPEIRDAGWMHMLDLKVDGLSSIVTNMEKPDTHPVHLFGDGNSGEKIVVEIQKFLQNRNHCTWQPNQMETK